MSIDAQVYRGSWIQHRVFARLDQPEGDPSPPWVPVQPWGEDTAGRIPTSGSAHRGHFWAAATIGAVDIGAAFWVQRSSWPDLKAAVLAAEDAGFSSIWIDDHLLCDEGDPRDSKFEGWTIAAAVAAITTQVRVGHLVGANTFRNPGLTAKTAATLDHVSRGRFTLGIGGGWFEEEHRAFGLEFGASAGERLDRLDESVSLIRRLLDGETVTHDGRFYRFEEAVCAPRPVQRHLPMLIGGSGRTKTLRTVARYADVWNGYGEPARIGEVLGWLAEHCESIGRPIDEIRRTVVMDVVIRDTVEAAHRVYQQIERAHFLRPGQTESDDPDQVLNVGGPPELVADYLAGFRAIGVDEVMWILRSPWDRETIQRVAEVRDLI